MSSGQARNAPDAEVRADYRSTGPLGNHWIARLRPIAWVTLAFLLYWAGDPWNYVYALQLERLKAPTVGAATTEEQRDLRREIKDAVKDTRALIQEMRKTGNSAAVLAGAEGMDLEYSYFDALDAELRTALDAARTHIQSQGLPQEILDRQAAAEARHDDGFQQLKRDLQEAARLGRELDQAARSGVEADLVSAQDALLAALTSLESKLGEMMGEEDAGHTPLEPRQLPHRPAQAVTEEPRTEVGAFADLQAEVGAPDPEESEVRGTAPVLSMAAAATLPGPEDLGETVEIQLTPEITELAASLGNDPRRLFDFVRNEISFVPTRGSIQGAASCLRSRLCNATDTASLLIALLRASGVPARYATGTVEAPIAKVANLLGGFSDAGAALNFMASSGTPVAGVGDGAGNLLSARFEHVWVEAFLDYVPSRGAVTGGQGDTWVPLDPSFKELEIQPGLDVAAITGFDSRAFLIDEIFAGMTFDETTGAVLDLDLARAGQAAGEVAGEILSFMQQENIPPTLRDMAGGVTIVPSSLPLLPGSLPYQVVVRGAQFAEVPASLRHELRFEVLSGRFSISPDLTFSSPLAELAGRRITLSYGPASDADRAALQSFAPDGGEGSIEDFPTSLPAYLIQVRPELRIDGELVATGAAVTLGESGSFRMLFSEPGRGTHTVNNAITAGTYNAIVLNLGVAEDPDARRAEAQAVFDRIQAGDVAGLDKDDILGEYLHSGGLLYWSELELFSRIVQAQRGIRSARLPSEGIFTYDLKVLSLFGSPREVQSGALLTDVDTDLQALAQVDGDRDAVIDYFAVTGGQASRFESEIWDQSVPETPTQAGINTMSYLEAAAQQGIPIYQIDDTNVEQILPLLSVSSAVKTDVRNSVNAGRVVTIPEREFLKDGFNGVGYVVFDPETGAAGYLISSGLAGGGFQLPPVPGGAGVVALLGLLLIAIGAFATLAGAGLIAPIAAVAAILLAVYDAIATYQQIVRDNPNMGPDGQEAVAVVLAIGAIVSVGLSIIALFVTAPTIVAFLAVIAMWWIVYALLLTAIAIAMGALFDALGSQPALPLIARELRRWWERWQRWIGDEPGGERGDPALGGPLGVAGGLVV